MARTVDRVDVVLHDTDIPRVKATVGSESVMLFAEPLAQACAALRCAIAAGRATGMVTVTERPQSELRSMRAGGLIGISPEIALGYRQKSSMALFSTRFRGPAANVQFHR